MRSISKLAVLAACAFTALAYAGNALATPKLEVSQTASPSAVTIKVSQAQTDQQPAKITIYVPIGYTATLGQPAGTVIGTTTGEVFARDLNIPLPLQGDVVVDNPANHLTDACAPGAHAAVWILRLAVAGQTIALPVYVDPTAGAEAQLGVAKLVTCLGPADVPQGAPGRSPNGAQLLNASFTVNSVLTPPTSTQRWISFITPYTVGNGVPNPTGTVEVQSIVGPGTVSIGAKVTSKKKKTVTVSGSVRQGTAGAGGRVSILINGRARASATANASGRYSKKGLKGTGKRSTFQARVTVAARDLGAAGCVQSQAPIPCVDATAGGFTATSRKVTVRF